LATITLASAHDYFELLHPVTSIPITRLVAAMRTLAMRNLAIVVALGITACGGQSDTSVLTPPDTTTTEFVVPKDRTPLIVGGVEVTLLSGFLLPHTALQTIDAGK